MKKSVVFALLLCMTMVITSSVALAADSTLTSAQITHVGNVEWVAVPASKNMSNYSFRGTDPLSINVNYVGSVNLSSVVIGINGTFFVSGSAIQGDKQQTYDPFLGKWRSAVVYVLPMAQILKGAPNTVTITAKGFLNESRTDTVKGIYFMVQ